MGLKKVDLNLFTLFDALMRHRSVSATSRELGVTPSAVSHGLARLHRLIGAELFIGGPGGMTPTPLAVELAPNVHAGLARLAQTLAERGFDPATSERSFVVSVTDLGGTVLLPELMRVLLKEAPGVRLVVFPHGRQDTAEHLDSGRLDLIIGWFQRLPRHINRHTLFDVSEAIVVRPGHPLTQGVLTRERLLSFPHVVVELTGTDAHGGDGFVDDRGIRRRVWIERLVIETGDARNDLVGHVAITVPRYNDVSNLLLATDLVATLPLPLARQAANLQGIAVLTLPYEPMVVPYEMIWHERAAADPGLQWLIEQFRVVAASHRLRAEVSTVKHEGDAQSL